MVAGFAEKDVNKLLEEMRLTVMKIGGRSLTARNRTDLFFGWEKEARISQM